MNFWYEDSSRFFHLHQIFIRSCFRGRKRREDTCQRPSSSRPVFYFIPLSCDPSRLSLLSLIWGVMIPGDYHLGMKSSSRVFSLPLFPHLLIHRLIQEEMRDTQNNTGKIRLSSLFLVWSSVWISSKILLTSFSLNDWRQTCKHLIHVCCVEWGIMKQESSSSLEMKMNKKKEPGSAGKKKQATNFKDFLPWKTGTKSRSWHKENKQHGNRHS